MGWNKEGIIDRLRELVEVEKISFERAANTINAEFGTSFSRMACIGKARRIGIVVPPERVNRGFVLGDVPRKPRKPRKRGNDGGLGRWIGVKRERVEPYKPVVDADIPIEQRKTILELTDQTCRWPVGEGASLFFCGAPPLDGKPYCGAHCERAYTNHARGWERPDAAARLRKWRFGTVGVVFTGQDDQAA